MEQRIGKLNVSGYNVEADLSVRDIFHFHHATNESRLTFKQQQQQQ